ncbi:MAG TPA: hypothetical protein VHB77_02520 [Planctomycetaceae bacterium]|nr:hypothetical protein [Planctomycetaceae bacterium]
MHIDDIDFLPPTYRQNRLRRQKQRWHRGIAVVFLVCLMAGSIQQWRTRAVLHGMRERLIEQGNRMSAQIGSPDALHAELQRLEGQAKLLTFLRLRPCPTRVLIALSTHLPDNITLTELNVKPEARPRPISTTPATAKPADKSAPEKLPEEQDLDKLKASAEDTDLAVVVQGFAHDDLTLAGYLSALQREPLFTHVKLVYSDEHQLFDHKVRKFSARLLLRAPHTEAAESSVANTASRDATPVLSRRGG